MKYQLRAALAAIALMLLPGALLAGSASEVVTAESFDATTHTVTGLTSNSEIRQLLHSSATLHDYANVGYYPPGPSGPAMALMIEWNLAVFQNKPASSFDRLLDRAAKLGITLQVERTDTTDANGVFGLVKVAPVP